MSTTLFDLLQQELLSLQDSEKAKLLMRFFKTGKGQYGEGDIFLGVMVPKIRTLSKKYGELSLGKVVKLLRSKYHEERLLSLLILIEQFRQGDTKMKEKIYKTYLKNTNYINNWDLVDLTAPHIVGSFLQNKERDILYTLADSNVLWERRIAILSTFHFIKQGETKDAFFIADILLHDNHDLIHKAVGWMLREIGKRCSEEVEESFLNKHYKTMPRTMLRYAIERFSIEKRKYYMKKITCKS